MGDNNSDYTIKIQKKLQGYTLFNYCELNSKLFVVFSLVSNEEKEKKDYIYTKQ